MARIAIHPFPARMAPEIVLDKLRVLPAGAKVLDPMAGSGTVLRQAAALGLRAYGYDVDPLAVIIARTSVATLRYSTIIAAGERAEREARKLSTKKIILPWIDDDVETAAFVKYWFGTEQRKQLRCLAHSLQYGVGVTCRSEVKDALRVALSRIIVTKQRGASLAWDVSHSRPHRVIDTNDFDVFEEFRRSCRFVADRVPSKTAIRYKPVIRINDARHLSDIPVSYIDTIITSPPYLNAIDYLRGHRLALVWFGYRLSELRKIRSDSIGTECQGTTNELATYAVLDSFGNINKLPATLRGMLVRYAGDLVMCVMECARVLKIGGQAHFVIGDSKIRGVLIKNSQALTTAAEIAGFKLCSRTVRKLPPRLRYLPMVKDPKHSLAKRMTSELILSYSLMSK